jgi:hypothetical protein
LIFETFLRHNGRFPGSIPLFLRPNGRLYYIWGAVVTLE